MKYGLTDNDLPAPKPGWERDIWDRINEIKAEDPNRTTADAMNVINGGIMGSSTLLRVDLLTTLKEQSADGAKNYTMI